MSIVIYHNPKCGTSLQHTCHDPCNLREEPEVVELSQSRRLHEKALGPAYQAHEYPPA